MNADWVFILSECEHLGLSDYYFTKSMHEFDVRIPNIKIKCEFEIKAKNCTKNICKIYI